MSSNQSAYHEWRAQLQKLKEARQDRHKKRSRDEMVANWGEPTSGLFVREVNESESAFQSRIATDYARCMAWAEWSDNDIVAPAVFPAVFIVRFPKVPQQDVAQAPVQPMLPAPAPVRPLALPAPQQAAADTDDAFTDDPAVEVFPNPPPPGGPRPPKMENPLMTRRGRNTAARVTPLTSTDGTDWHAGWNGDPFTPDPQFAPRFVW